MEKGHRKKVYRPVLERGVGQKVLIYKRDLGEGLHLYATPSAAGSRELHSDYCDGETEGFGGLWVQGTDNPPQPGKGVF